MADTNEQVLTNNKEEPKIIIKNVFNRFLDGFRNWKYFMLVVVLLFVATMAFCVWMFLKSHFDTKNLNERAEELYNLKNYNTSILNSNNSIKNEITSTKTLDELIDYNIKIDWMRQGFEDYLKWIQASYDNFLSYILLPSLNIWKDPFLGEIDYNMIWKRFLEKNPYNDIDLINRRSDFIKDVGNDNEYNEIESIELWEMVEVWEEFYVPVTVSYVAPSYRWFLLLLEKMSVTSNQKNISLLNEFVYNMWQVIKSENPDEITKAQEIYTGFSEDKALWYMLYLWVKWNDDYPLVTDDVVDKTIRKIVVCWDEDSIEYCYYKFRDKYRTLPGLAYTIWLESNWSGAAYLRTFFQNLPQVMKISSFTYDWETVKDMVNFSKKQYKWSISFNLYGDWLSSDEVVEIQDLLWWMCLWEKLTPESALKQINSKLTSIWKDTEIDTYTTTRLMELESLISGISSSFGGLSNYKKVVRTFEMYRMLNEWNICNI